MLTINSGLSVKKYAFILIIIWDLGKDKAEITNKIITTMNATDKTCLNSKLKKKS